jgi:hypothetical protein
MNNHENFLQAIHEKKLIQVKFNSHEKGVIQRVCVPFDFGPWQRNVSPNPDRYHLYDLDSPEGSHNLSVLPGQIISIEHTKQNFDPAQYITWQPPYNWFVPRNWGIYS